MKYQYDEDLRYHSDVKDKFGYANISKFPKDFDVKKLKELKLKNLQKIKENITQYLMEKIIFIAPLMIKKNW